MVKKNFQKQIGLAFDKSIADEAILQNLWSPINLYLTYYPES
jgi:hypothetical protein